MGLTQNKKADWYPIRSGHECPVCGSKKGRCGFMENEEGNIVLFRCKNKTSNRPSSDGWYIHLANELNGDASEKFNDIVCKDYKYEPITDELLDLWDRVYRKFKEVFIYLNGSALYENHKKDLIKRGLDESTIKEIGCFSVPRNTKIHYKNYTCSLRTAIVHELLNYFNPESLIRVPGFKKANSKGKEYITFVNTIYSKKDNAFIDLDAYFIPYLDFKGRLVGMQYRLMEPIVDEDGKIYRYLWYVTKNVVSCGSPINYNVPSAIEIDDVILITEGALKGKIASVRLGIRTLSEAGVSNYRRLIEELHLIEQLEGRKFKRLLALDMDKYTNTDVLKAEINTVAMLKADGEPVYILEWDIDEGKGIDDKTNISKKNFRYLTV
ncbi:DUF3854 domain-containing protein [uncultured Clostridium sp.]|uniref:DUF3854 domain-containing protein n=1 Tax=uncultured Clostridium sp. TaxID=59620 RepID=UPI0028E9A614|nr:DUF3854 domain-containing protein [uncultured Clostridium sp.]